jgi:hypothetical protein
MSPRDLDDLLQPFDEDPAPFDHRRMLQTLSHAVRMRDRTERDVTHRFVLCMAQRR